MDDDNAAIKELAQSKSMPPPSLGEQLEKLHDRLTLSMKNGNLIDEAYFRRVTLALHLYNTRINTRINPELNDASRSEKLTEVAGFEAETYSKNTTDENCFSL